MNTGDVHHAMKGTVGTVWCVHLVAQKNEVVSNESTASSHV